MPIIEWNPSPSYSSRNGRKPIAIVDHITAGSFPGCLNWLCNPASKASSHYLVTKTGQIFQLVKEEARAHHAGVVDRPTWKLYDRTNPNNYTIGIEHESLGEGLTEEQYQSSLWLHKQIINTWEIPIDSDHIVGHNKINADHAGCPGKDFPWDRLFNDLKGNDTLKVAVLLFTKEDYWAGYDIAVKHDNCAIFIRGSKGEISQDAMSSEKLIVVGGGKTGHKNEVWLSGNDKYDTAANVAKYLKG